MKKIILPFDGANFPTAMLEFARCLNRSSPILLTAVFVPEIDYAQLWDPLGGMVGAVYVPQVPDEDLLIKERSARVEEFCLQHGIKFRIHTDRFDFALPAIRKEALFADLLVLSASHFFDIISARQPNAYMKEILHSAVSPVMVIPEKADLPGEIILTYDGSEASIYAIKQFAYLFPELASTNASLVHLKEKKETPFPDKGLIEEWAFERFSKLRVLDLHIRPEDFFETWLAAQQQPWLVCGSYGRSDLSRFFSGSFVSELISKHKIPLFIAHP